MYDYHVHSNYSDGRYLSRMVEGATEAGLEGVGIADHCIVSPRDERRRDRATYGFTLDETYERRRRAIERIRESTSVAVYDAAEVDYDPRDEAAIREFLEAADFDYTVGSVHELDGANVQVAANYADRTAGERDALVNFYFEKLEAMIESELFDVAAHPDLVERTPPLAGRATTDQYRRIARAFVDSRTVPEINVGRALREDSLVHPRERFLEVLVEHDVSFAVGTDSHEPGEIGPRAEFLSDLLAERGIRPVTPPGLDR